MTGNKLTIENINGLPAKKKTFNFDLKQIEQIDIIQTHQGRYDRRYMVVHGNFEPTEINMNFRYFQLVKIQDFFNEQLKIKKILKG